MANNSNIEGKGFDSRTTEEQREIARQGGIASGEARRKKKLLSDLINNEFEKNVSIKSGEETIELTKKELAALRLVRIINDPGTTDKVFLKALEFARDTIGERPIEKTMSVDVDPDVMAEVERIVDENIKQD